MRKPLLLLSFIICGTASFIPRPIQDAEFNLDAVTEWDTNTDVFEELPQISKADKWEMIVASGQDIDERRLFRHRVRRARKQKRDILLTPWRIQHVIKKPTVKPVTRAAVALPVGLCPRRFDAVTRGYNGRTYVFSRERVYQTWHEDGLQQKGSYLITELFPGGPRSVTAALTNSRSGVTILIENRTVYRFRWNRKHKRFQLAKNTPQDLPRNVTITPQTAFEWSDGNQVVLAGDHFIIYDAYWNLATFTGHTRRYFPNLPKDLLGIVYNGGDTVLMFTKHNSLKVYSTKKFKVVQEYPLKINEFVGCLGS